MEYWKLEIPIGFKEWERGWARIECLKLEIQYPIQSSNWKSNRKINCKSNWKRWEKEWARMEYWKSNIQFNPPIGNSIGKGGRKGGQGWNIGNW